MVSDRIHRRGSLGRPVGSRTVVTAPDRRIAYDRTLRIGKAALAENILEAGGGTVRLRPARRYSSPGRPLGPDATASHAAGRRQLSGLIKRSFSLAGHRTSVALEEEFWAALAQIAADRGQTLTGLVATTDAARDPGRPLASALRIRALQEFARRA